MHVRDERPLAICLLGPTASGKTALALALDDRLGCGIVSVDSAQIYRGMDIGTAKPDQALLARHPHRLIDIRDPAEVYSAAEFRADALAAIAGVLAAGRTPLLVGGTMLYFRALLGGLAELPAADPAIRAEIAALAARELGGGAPAPRRARPGERGAHRPGEPPAGAAGPRGLCGERAHTEQPARRAAAPADLPCRFLQLALVPTDRARLHRRIATRFDAMLAAGFLDEVAALRARGDLHLDLPSMRSVGYRQAWQYLDGQGDRRSLVERAVAATRQLAKRQLTWLRGWPGLVVLPGDEPHEDALLAAALKSVAAASI